MPSTSMIIWLAGLFDGEGNLTLSLPTRANYHTIRLAFTNTDTDILKAIQQILDTWGLHYVKALNNPIGKGKDGFTRKPCWQIAVQRQAEVKFLLGKISPYLKSKRFPISEFYAYFAERETRKDGRSSNRRKLEVHHSTTGV